MRIAIAACRQVAYDYGFREALAYTSLPKWEAEINEAISVGVNQDPLSPQHSGRTSYCEQIEKKHPHYHHELYRYAIKTRGAKSTYAEIADVMNQKSGAPGEARETLNLHHRDVSCDSELMWVSWIEWVTRCGQHFHG
jgi:hypothetical protein